MSHRQKPLLHVPFADELAERLLAFCPLSAVTLLTILVGGLARAGLRPWLFLAAMMLADVGINVVRTARTRRLPGRSLRRQTTGVRTPYGDHRPVGGR